LTIKFTQSTTKQPLASGFCKPSTSRSSATLE